MSRLLLFLLAVLVAVLAVGYAVRSHRTSTFAVASLVPEECVALIHIPDLEKARDDWHASDIYRLYLEPSVQDFLRKPLSRLPHSAGVAKSSKELRELDAKDIFIALTSMTNDPPTFVGGLRYNGRRSDAEKIINQWRDKLLGAGAKPEVIDYQKNRIEVARVGSITICTTFQTQWFLASNKVEELESTIDRLRGTGKPGAHSLATDQNFRDAMSHIPADYALGFYLQPKSFADKLADLQKSAGQSTASAQMEILAKIRSFCGATRFDAGKLHDFFFVGTPELIKAGDLTRNSLALTTADTFLYGAVLLDLSKQFALTDPSVSSSFLGPRLQKIGRDLVAAGITPADWEAVFGRELGLMADWHADNRVPMPLVTFPVKDFAKAKPMAKKLAFILDDDGQWKESESNGVHYISSPYKMGFVALQPTIAVSEHFLVAGFDMSAVQSAMARAAGGGSDVTSSGGYKLAVKALPPPTRAFSYLDLGLLYTRLDAAFRPMLLMGAAFMPAMNEYVDVTKLPTPETLARHLTPIVSSQRYERDGYAGESIGPITLSQTGIGVAAAVTVGMAGYRYHAMVPGNPGMTPLSPGNVPVAGASGGFGGRTGSGLKNGPSSPSPTPMTTP